MHIIKCVQLVLFIHLDELYKTISKNRLAKTACSGARSVFLVLLLSVHFVKTILVRLYSYVYDINVYQVLNNPPKRNQGVRIGAHFTLGADVRPAALPHFFRRKFVKNWCHKNKNVAFMLL